jgi:hypothetical protein
VTEHLYTPGDDFAAIALDDEFLDALAAGDAPTATDGSVDMLLVAWRDELSDAVPTPTLVLPTQRDGAGDAIDRLRVRRRRGAAGAAALVVVFAASTGVAAALPGNPLHRALFGDSRQDETLGRVQQMLATVHAAIDDAREAGGITDVDRVSLGNRLDAAQQLALQHDVGSPSLTDEIADLRAALAALPVLDPAAAEDPVGPADRSAPDSADDGPAGQVDGDDSGTTSDTDDGAATSGDGQSTDTSDGDRDTADGDSDDGSSETSSRTSDTDSSSDSSDSEDASTSDGEFSDGEGSDYGLSGSDGGSSWDSAETEGEAASSDVEG